VKEIASRVQHQRDFKLPIAVDPSREKQTGNPVHNKKPKTGRTKKNDETNGIIFGVVRWPITKRRNYPQGSKNEALPNPLCGLLHFGRKSLIK